MSSLRAGTLDNVEPRRVVFSFSVVQGTLVVGEGCCVCIRRIFCLVLGGSRVLIVIVGTEGDVPSPTFSAHLSTCCCALSTRFLYLLGLTHSLDECWCWLRMNRPLTYFTSLANRLLSRPELLLGTLFSAVLPLELRFITSGKADPLRRLLRLAVVVSSA